MCGDRAERVAVGPPAHPVLEDVAARHRGRLVARGVALPVQGVVGVDDLPPTRRPPDEVEVLLREGRLRERAAEVGQLLEGDASGGVDDAAPHDRGTRAGPVADVEHRRVVVEHREGGEASRRLGADGRLLGPQDDVERTLPQDALGARERGAEGAGVLAVHVGVVGELAVARREGGPARGRLARGRGGERRQGQRELVRTIVTEGVGDRAEGDVGTVGQPPQPVVVVLPRERGDEGPVDTDHRRGPREAGQTGDRVRRGLHGGGLRLLQREHRRQAQSTPVGLPERGHAQLGRDEAHRYRSDRHEPRPPQDRPVLHVGDHLGLRERLEVLLLEGDLDRVGELRVDRAQQTDRPRAREDPHGQRALDVGLVEDERRRRVLVEVGEGDVEERRGLTAAGVRALDRAGVRHLHGAARHRRHGGSRRRHGHCDIGHQTQLPPTRGSP